MQSIIGETIRDCHSLSWRGIGQQALWCHTATLARAPTSAANKNLSAKKFVSSLFNFQNKKTNATRVSLWILLAHCHASRGWSVALGSRNIQCNMWRLVSLNLSSCSSRNRMCETHEWRKDLNAWHAIFAGQRVTSTHVDMRTSTSERQTRFPVAGRQQAW